MDNICDIETCTGCGVCVDVCHKQAVTLDYGDGFFLHPIIDQEKCVDCGLCQKRCPIINYDDSFKHDNICTYAAWSTNIETYFESATAGIATEISRYYLSRGGVVVGCGYDEHMVATHRIGDNEEDIKSFLSRNKDTYKFPYDRYAADHLRQCVFAGTTNKTDFLPIDRSGNRRFLPVQVHPERAEVHILADEAASRAYINQMWSEIMAIYKSGEYSIHLNRDMEKQLAQEQEQYQQEDTLAGQIYSFMENFPGNKLCSKQIYHEGLNHPYDEPKQWETREIFEIVNIGIANGSIQGWRPFPNSRRFDKYGTQRGWERIPAQAAHPVTPSVNQPVGNFEQIGFIEVVPDHDFPF